VGFFGKRKNEDALNAEAFAFVPSGDDPFEGSPFYGKFSPEEGMEVELLFGRAGMSVIHYVFSRLEALPKEELQAAALMFGDAAAKAEFHLRCQKTGPDAVEAWLAGHQEEGWVKLRGLYPSLASSHRKETLIADARSLINRNWDNVMMVATAYAAPSIDIQGREDEFLDKFYVEPDDD